MYKFFLKLLWKVTVKALQPRIRINGSTVTFSNIVYTQETDTTGFQSVQMILQSSAPEALVTRDINDSFR